MKICILTPRFSIPENGGDVLRINNIARYLKKNGHYLILISFYIIAPTSRDIQEIHEIYNEIYLIKFNKFFSSIYAMISFLLGKPIQVGYYFSFKFLQIIKKINKNEKPNLYIAHLLRTVSYLNILKLQKNTIVELTDALSKTYWLSKKSTTKSLKKIIYKFEENPVKKYEQKIIKNFFKVVLVSKSDKYFLGNYNNIYVFANGITYIDNPLNSYDKNKIVFVGNMRTLQNQDGVIYFLNKIFPSLLKKFPNLRFYIVGAEPPIKILQYANNKSVFVTGFVHSIEELISDALLSVACINIAAGIQNKVLISMACGIPVILSKTIANSIPELENKKNCIISKTADEYITNISYLILNTGERNKIGNNGYQMIKKYYTWDNQLLNYEK